MAGERPRHARLLNALGAERRARPLRRRRGSRRTARHPASDLDLATRLDPRRGRASGSKAPEIKAVPTGIDHGTITAVSRGQVGRGHHAAPRRVDRRPPRDGRLHRRLEGGRRRGATSPSTPSRPIRSAARCSTISAASTTSQIAAQSASSATRSSASPRIICGSCASSASTPASARRARPACARRLHRARQRPHGLVARAHRRRAVEAARARRPDGDRRDDARARHVRPVAARDRSRAAGRSRSPGRSRAERPESRPTRCAGSPRCCRAIPALAETIAARLKLSNKARKRLACAADADLDLVARRRWPIASAPNARSTGCCSPGDAEAAAIAGVDAAAAADQRRGADRPRPARRAGRRPHAAPDRGRMGQRPASRPAKTFEAIVSSALAAVS